MTQSVSPKLGLPRSRRGSEGLQRPKLDLEHLASSEHGVGSGPFRDANRALAPRESQAASPDQDAPSTGQAFPASGQSVTLTLPSTWGAGKQLRLRFADGACTACYI